MKKIKLPIVLPAEEVTNLDHNPALLREVRTLMVQELLQSQARLNLAHKEKNAEETKKILNSMYECVLYCGLPFLQDTLLREIENPHFSADSLAEVNQAIDITLRSLLPLH